MVTKCQSNPTDKRVPVEDLDSNAVYKIIAEHTPCRADNGGNRSRLTLARQKAGQDIGPQAAESGTIDDLLEGDYKGQGTREPAPGIGVLHEVMVMPTQKCTFFAGREQKKKRQDLVLLESWGSVN